MRAGLLLFLAALAGCAAPAPCPVCKPEIPADLLVVCFQGRLYALSDAAQEFMPLSVRCGPGRAERPVHTKE